MPSDVFPSTAWNNSVVEEDDPILETFGREVGVHVESMGKFSYQKAFRLRGDLKTFPIHTAIISVDKGEVREDFVYRGGAREETCWERMGSFRGTCDRGREKWEVQKRKGKELRRGKQRRVEWKGPSGTDIDLAVDTLSAPWRLSAEEIVWVEEVIWVGTHPAIPVGDDMLTKVEYRYAIHLVSSVPGYRYHVGRRMPLLRLRPVRAKHVRLRRGAHRGRRRRQGLLLARLGVYKCEKLGCSFSMFIFVVVVIGFVAAAFVGVLLRWLRGWVRGWTSAAALKAQSASS